MTPRPSPLSSFILHPSSFRRSRAFSLIEILVVIGIIVTLLGITVMYLSKARKTAARTRQAADFQAIAMALDAYKTDHGDYPRAFGTGTGFASLGRFLIAPGPATFNPASPGNSSPPDNFQAGKGYEGGEVVLHSGAVYVATHHNDAGIAPAPPPTSDYWWPALWADYADGPGFRVRPQAQLYSPYLQPDRFRIRNFAILDLWGNPILYFPARAGSINVNLPSPMPPNAAPSFVWDSRDTSFTPNLAKPLYDVADNLGMLHGKASQPATSAENVEAREKLQKFLGDANTDGWIGQGETAVTTGPYILWSAGADAEENHEYEYGLDDNGKTDDVTNFDLPVGFLKK